LTDTLVERRRDPTDKVVAFFQLRLKGVNLRKGVKTPMREGAKLTVRTPGSVTQIRGASAWGVPYGHVDVAHKTSGLHKVLHCEGTPKRARWEHAGINRFLPRHILCGDHRRHRFHRLESIVAGSTRVKTATKHNPSFALTSERQS
jgi:hypothetical protein